ncbi:inositol-3-phosphate synthase [Halogeometricum sp. S1BR25-6]|uniref:Inositol-3-phosphate synthase n=1 Tax=Halogeometricum salsisoli TaxID=2950536 RepID=A0ABU2GEK0_9EURY|nr:inositol-3-phosphate synthase [Halogeometricum sp. S1BR25-6]MDS0298881.1 inositol-3-phosphate synthase [Halogeometricum sp. S1BR25-6]
MTRTRTGVWFVGARGNVAATAISGARGIARGTTDDTGMVTAREPCTRLDLPPVDGFVFSGHDIAERPLLHAATDLADSGIVDRATLEAVADDLREIDERIETGTARNCGSAVSLADGDTLDSDHGVSGVVEQIRADYAAFAEEHDVDRLVVVNLASSEPPMRDPERYDTLDAFEAALEADDADLPASSLYAYAALVDGHPYVNFTPSTGSELGGLRELADRENVPHVGRDAKTGETLLKTALGPMFAGRNLNVMSWDGFNILGNGDGKVLDDDDNKAGKLQSKGGVLSEVLGSDAHNRVRIDYTPSLGDWKTAWDHVHFEGFMNTKMTLQFTWQGADSALAAPLVLDLVRLVSYADEHGEGGTQTHLASFFKEPMDVDEHDLSRQFAMLESYVEAHRDDAAAESTDPVRTDGGGDEAAGTGAGTNANSDADTVREAER